MSERQSSVTKETEAESIAFTVCSALGIDTSDYSFPYVASWASGKEMKELKDSMDTIRLTAADFLEDLEAAVEERSAERMTAMQYAEKLITDKEQGKTIFDDEQRNLIVNFAFKLDDRAATEELVNGIAAALAEDDKEEVNRLMYEAQEKIENLPDGINYFRDDKLVQQAISDMEKLMAARQQSKEQERSNTKKSVLDALRSLKAKKQEQPAQEQDKPKKAKKKGMEL